jgi:hypothetical protein
MNDLDYIKLWLIGFISLLGIAIFLGIMYYKANIIVDAAYRASTPIVKAME